MYTHNLTFLHINSEPPSLSKLSYLLQNIKYLVKLLYKCLQVSKKEEDSVTIQFLNLAGKCVSVLTLSSHRVLTIHHVA